MKLRKKQIKRAGGSLIYHGFILLFGFFMFYPVLWLVASSFKEHAEIFQNADSLIPASFRWQNYVQGWRGFGGVTFGTFFKNSLIISGTSTIGQIITASMVAYGFSRIKFIGKKFWFRLMIITLLLPAQVMQIPQYILFNKLGWIDTFKPLIIPGFLAGPFFVFLMVQFIQGLPMELDEAARIDGCGRYSIYFRIILPNIKPALITAGIFSFYWSWNNFMQGLMYIQTPRKYPAALALQLFSDPQSVTHWGAMFAMATLSLVPIFIIFISFQQYLVEGISTTGLKG